MIIDSADDVVDDDDVKNVLILTEKDWAFIRRRGMR